jgi:hypothetical protein
LDQLYDNTLINVVQTLIKHGHFGALHRVLDDVIDKYKNYYICDYYMDLIVDELVKVKNSLFCFTFWFVIRLGKFLMEIVSDVTLLFIVFNTNPVERVTIRIKRVSI